MNAMVDKGLVTLDEVLLWLGDCTICDEVSEVKDEEVHNIE